ncbi:Dihydroorotase [Trichinella pseudospiralis]
MVRSGRTFKNHLRKMPKMEMETKLANVLLALRTIPSAVINYHYMKCRKAGSCQSVIQFFGEITDRDRDDSMALISEVSSPRNCAVNRTKGEMRHTDQLLQLLIESTVAIQHAETLTKDNESTEKRRLKMKKMGKNPMFFEICQQELIKAEIYG